MPERPEHQQFLAKLRQFGSDCQRAENLVQNLAEQIWDMADELSALLAAPQPPQEQAWQPMEMTEVQRKAWKLIEALAEPCDTVKKSGDHAWQRCRRCLATEELEHRGTRALLMSLLEYRDQHEKPSRRPLPPPPGERDEKGPR